MTAMIATARAGEDRIEWVCGELFESSDEGAVGNGRAPTKSDEIVIFDSFN